MSFHSALVQFVIFATVVGIAFTVSASVMADISAEADTIDPDEEYNLTGPEYQFGVGHILLLLAPLVVFPLVRRYAMRPPATHSPRRDTPEKAIDRYKRQYIDGDLSLEEFEDRVYRTIPVEVEDQ